MAEAQAEQQANAQEQQQEGGEEKKAPPSKVYSQEEVDRIADKVRRNARRDAELKLRREQQSAPPQKPEQEERKDPPADEDPDPKRDDFPDYETFQKAVAEHAGRKAAREERKKEREEETAKAQREQHEKAARTWHGKIEAAVKKHPDFEDVLEDNDDVLEVIYKAKMREAVTESDIGPEIVRHLCLNKAEATRIAALPGYKQAAEIAKIEETLLAAGKKPADAQGDEEEDPKGDDEEGEEKASPPRAADGTFRKEKKDPPPPIEPGTGRPATNSSLPSDKDDPETWRRKELARMAKRQQGK